MVFLLLVLVCLLTSLNTAGVTAGGAMLNVFNRIVWLVLVGGLCLSLDLSRLYRGLSCGRSFLLFSLLMPFVWEVDNLGAVRHVGRLLDDYSCSHPLELVTDGDLLVLIRRVLDLRGRDTVCITKVKGHADEDMVLDGRVRELDRLGNDAADEAADFGRRRVGNAVIDARRNLSGGGRWYPVILDLHRFFIAISRVVVNHDGRDGTDPDPLVWSAGAHPKRRQLVHAVRYRAFLPGPPGIWDSEWGNVPASVICAEDIAQWHYTTGLLVKWVSFFRQSTLACKWIGSWSWSCFLCGIAHSS